MSSIHTLTLPGAMIKRGCWLYVWKIASPCGELLYVGRSGDSSSPNAAAPFTRMGQHLGTNDRENPVRRYLEQRRVPPERCTSFELIAYGPIFEEARDPQTHTERRDIVAGLEKALADSLARSGYDVLNEVRSRKRLDVQRWIETREAFAAHFEGLSETVEEQPGPDPRRA